MSEQDDKSKPDGWVAWHPVHGVKDRVLSTHKRIAKNQLDMLLYGKMVSDHLSIADGWRIRPVKLVFLDEVEK